MGEGGGESPRPSAGAVEMNLPDEDDLLGLLPDDLDDDLLGGGNASAAATAAAVRQRSAPPRPSEQAQPARLGAAAAKAAASKAKAEGDAKRAAQAAAAAAAQAQAQAAGRGGYYGGHRYVDEAEQWAMEQAWQADHEAAEAEALAEEGGEEEDGDAEATVVLQVIPDEVFTHSDPPCVDCPNPECGAPLAYPPGLVFLGATHIRCEACWRRASLGIEFTPALPVPELIDHAQEGQHEEGHHRVGEGAGGLAGQGDRGGGAGAPVPAGAGEDKIPVPCRFFLMGGCSYGGSCKYMHSHEAPIALLMQEAAAAGPRAPTMEMGLQECKWGRQCQRHDCYFRHPHGREMEDAAAGQHAGVGGHYPQGGGGMPHGAGAYPGGSGPGGLPLDSVPMNLRRRMYEFKEEHPDWWKAGSGGGGNPNGGAPGASGGMQSQAKSSEGNDSQATAKWELIETFAHPQAADEHGGNRAECGICFEVPHQVSLLPGCDHVFCKGCISSWRHQHAEYGSEAVRACPLCRAPSYYTVPFFNDTRVLCDPDLKQAVINRYREHIYSIPCKHFAFGQGDCPFGSSCFYGHFNPDGTRCTWEGSGIRKRVNEDGEVSVVKEATLADFLFPKLSLA